MKEEKNNWVEKQIKKKRELIEQTINKFTEMVSSIEGIIELYLFGPLAGRNKNCGRR